MASDQTMTVAVGLTVPPKVVDAARAILALAEDQASTSESAPVAAQPASTSAESAPAATEFAAGAPDHEVLLEKQRQREATFGIPILDTGALTPPKGQTPNPDEYADPVNFKYPVNDAAHAKNARSRFKQHADEYPTDAARKIVHGRIVEAQLKFKVNPAIDASDPLDKLLPAEVRSRAETMVHADAEPVETVETQPVQPVDAPVVESFSAAARGALQMFRDMSGVETFNVPDVEIFATGVWKDQKFTLADLHEIAANYRELRPRWEPPLKIGHMNTLGERTMQDDSLPSLGWAQAIRVKELGPNEAGEPQGLLLGDFTDVPRLVRDVVKARAYKHVSAELYRTFTDGATGKKYGKTLKAVALLGAALPEVKSLREVTLLYHDTPPRDDECVVICTDIRPEPRGGTPMDQTELEKQLAETRAANVAMAKQLREITAKSRDAEALAFCAEQKSKGVLIPALEPKALALLKLAGRISADFAEAQPQMFSDAGGATLVDVAKDLIASMPKVVVFSEQMPQPAPTVAATPGAPAQAASVDTYTDGADRTYQVKGRDLMSQARDLMTKNPGLRLEDAVAKIQPGPRTAAL